MPRRPRCEESAGDLDLSAVEQFTPGSYLLSGGDGRASPDEPALALMGDDPPVIPQHAQRLDDGRPCHTELSHELMLAR
ncbi:hypothetical protein GCM10027612_70590 [Microbispora bryophytorum subsp. camponoti]